jgi:hypothetical protein
VVLREATGNHIGFINLAFPPSPSPSHQKWANLRLNAQLLKISTSFWFLGLGSSAFTLPSSSEVGHLMREVAQLLKNQSLQHPTDAYVSLPG